MIGEENTTPIEEEDEEEDPIPVIEEEEEDPIPVIEGENLIPVTEEKNLIAVYIIVSIFAVSMTIGVSVFIYKKLILRKKEDEERTVSGLRRQLDLSLLYKSQRMVN